MSLIFTEFVLWWKFILFAMFLLKSDICGNFGSWDMGQNVLIQSDCSIFKSAISPKQKNPDLLHVDTNSRKWKIDQKFFGWVLLEMGVAGLFMGL